MNNENSVLRIADHNAKLTPEQLAEALYEGTPHLQNLAEKLARQHGKAEALTFFGMMGQDVKDFWIGLAHQIIKHSTGWDKNNGSACVLSEKGREHLKETKSWQEFTTLGDLKNFLNTLNEKQLSQRPVLVMEDEFREISCGEITTEDWVMPEDADGSLPVSDYDSKEWDDLPLDHPDNYIIEKGLVRLHTDI